MNIKCVWLANSISVCSSDGVHGFLTSTVWWQWLEQTVRSFTPLTNHMLSWRGALLTMIDCSLIKIRKKKPKQKQIEGKPTLGLIQHYPMMPSPEYLTKSGLSWRGEVSEEEKKTIITTIIHLRMSSRHLIRDYWGQSPLFRDSN